LESHVHGEHCATSTKFREPPPASAFAKTQEDRRTNGDPRRSLQERYGTHEGYVAAVRRAAERAMAEGFLLKADAEALVKAAQESSVLR
jgi:hypothetical protein